jgi:hypothetical protein
MGIFKRPEIKDEKCASVIQPSTKVVINNPKFWTIPLRCFMGCKQEDFICSLDNFASLPPLTKNFYIPTDVISNALNACGFPKQRHKFAINLFRHVCTISLSDRFYLLQFLADNFFLLHFYRVLRQ